MSNIIFGPINSRRFGKSLGVDLSPQTKQCNYDCLYCELAPADTVDSYSEILSVEEIMESIQEALVHYGDIDVLTITANGEPTLYPNLRELIDRINLIKGSTKTLILSNGSTIDDKNIQETLLKIDTVKLSLDCASQKCLQKIDRLHNGIDIENIKKGMLEFKSKSKNTLIMEVLVVEGVNDKEEHFKELNRFFTELRPHRIDLGTIDRPPAYGVKPVSYDKLRDLSLLLDPSLIVHITHRKIVEKGVSSYSNQQILSTLHKRPLSDDDVDILFDTESKDRLKQMQEDGEIGKLENNGVFFYINIQNSPKSH